MVYIHFIIELKEFLCLVPPQIRIATKKIVKKNKSSDKEFIYYRLIESYRTEKGPRHRNIINLGKLNIPESKFKLLADRIEQILYGQKNLFATLLIIGRLVNPGSELRTLNWARNLSGLDELLGGISYNRINRLKEKSRKNEGRFFVYEMENYQRNSIKHRRIHDKYENKR